MLIVIVCIIKINGAKWQYPQKDMIVIPTFYSITQVTKADKICNYSRKKTPETYHIGKRKQTNASFDDQSKYPPTPLFWHNYVTKHRETHEIIINNSI